MKTRYLSLFLYVLILGLPCLASEVTSNDATDNAIEETLQLDCATRVFAVPGVRFMQKVRTVDPTAHVSAIGLPHGLRWNAKRRLIEGTLNEEGIFTYTLYVEKGTKSQSHTVTLTCSSHLPQPTPFMGMLTWNVLEEAISADKVYALADAFQTYGLADAGYKYLCLDDEWAEHERTDDGRLQYMQSKFPDGLNKVADYVHGKGLKFGIYSDAGTYTCSGAQPGSYLYEESDAKSFADWDFDLLKYDYCNNPGESVDTALRLYSAMGQALQRYARPSFVYYLCEWGQREPWKWGAETGGTCWRCTPDTRDCWTNPTYQGGVLDNIRIFKHIGQYTGVNRWNDADMVMCGLHGTGKSSNAGTDGKGMTQEEYRTQFALWCMFSSPISLSFDITALGGQEGVSGVTNPYYRDDLAMITNRNLIALDQDRLGQSGEPIYDTDDYIVFMKDLENGDVAISVTNLNDSTSQRIPLHLSDFPALEGNGTQYRMLDCWTNKTSKHLYDVSQTFVSPSLCPHETAVYRLSKSDRRK